MNKMCLQLGQEGAKVKLSIGLPDQDLKTLPMLLNAVVLPPAGLINHLPSDLCQLVCGYDDTIRKQIDLSLCNQAEENDEVTE